MEDNKPYKRLLVWQKAYQLILDVYRRTESFPKHEMYGVTSQLRRAVVSVAANIVEGSAKKSVRDYQRFLYISKGSLEETEFFIGLAKDLNYLQPEIYQQLDHQRGEVSYLLNRLIKWTKQQK